MTTPKQKRFLRFAMYEKHHLKLNVCNQFSSDYGEDISRNTQLKSINPYVNTSKITYQLTFTFRGSCFGFRRRFSKASFWVKKNIA